MFEPKLNTICLILCRRVRQVFVFALCCIATALTTGSLTHDALPALRRCGQTCRPIASRLSATKAVEASTTAPLGGCSPAGGMRPRAGQASLARDE